MAELNQKRELSSLLISEEDLDKISPEESARITFGLVHQCFGEHDPFKYLADQSPKAKADMLQRLRMFAISRGLEKTGFTVEHTGEKEKVYCNRLGVFYERERLIITTRDGRQITQEEAEKLSPDPIPMRDVRGSYE